jgi:hypothetical protein
MSMKHVHDKEFSAVVAMPAPDRYALFVRRVADWQEVWSLRSSAGYSLMADDDGTELMPIWPHKRFAEACAAESTNEQAIAIPLEEWLAKWVPGLIKDNRKVGVFPTPSGKGIVVSPAQLQSDLSAECEQYE